MVLSDEKKKKFIKRLLMSRMRLLMTNGFYGLLLMHMLFSLDENCRTAYTDGQRIAFNPYFLDGLSDRELDFVMMHEILHVVLRHCARGGERDGELFNIAADIVVNSNILLSNNMDPLSITLNRFGQSMHLAPDGKEGYEYTAEQVYDMLPTPPKRRPEDGPGKKGGGSGRGNKSGGGSGIAAGRAVKQTAEADTDGSWDDHTHWGETEEDDEMRDVWIKRFEDACEAISVRDPLNARGTMPLFAQRIFKELRRPQTDWRTALNDFVQEETVDYSFTPPDRRFDDSPFFLPDFNDKDDILEDILFMIDTSGSMSDDMITAAYSEIKGAIDQFDGKLKGWLGFFDAAIIEPTPFVSEEEFKVIKPAGGGGTDFQIIFEYVHRYMSDKPPACIIILTDGYAPFPKQELATGVPVLWIINNEDVTPPWGKVARITV